MDIEEHADEPILGLDEIEHVAIAAYAFLEAVEAAGAAVAAKTKDPVMIAATTRMIDQMFSALAMSAGVDRERLARWLDPPSTDTGDWARAWAEQFRAKYSVAKDG